MKLSKMKKLRRYLFCFLSILLLSVTLLPANAYADTSLRGESIYQIMVDRFYDGDSGNNAAGEAFRYTDLPVGQTIEFKAIRKDINGKVTWQNGNNHTYTVPANEGNVEINW